MHQLGSNRCTGYPGFWIHRLNPLQWQVQWQGKWTAFYLEISHQRPPEVPYNLCFPLKKERRSYTVYVQTCWRHHRLSSPVLTSRVQVSCRVFWRPGWAVEWWLSRSQLPSQPLWWITCERHPRYYLNGPFQPGGHPIRHNTIQDVAMAWQMFGM